MAQPQYIYGIHDAEGSGLINNAGKPGWILVSAVASDPGGDFSAYSNQNLGVIVRLNNGYGSAGTIPNSSQYDQFAQQCKNYAASSKGCKIWVIGNEMNLAWERPGNDNGNGGEVITPQLYSQCFAKCRAAIKSVAGHTDDQVANGAPAPWNNQTSYPGNPSGDWVKYLQDILTQCIALKQPPDAIALHAYTHGNDPATITSEDKMGGAFPNLHSQFRAYRDFMSAIPATLKSVPVFITETQPADPSWWQNVNNGWVRAAFKEINDWNAVAANQPIQALCLFRWLTGDNRWSIQDKPAVQADFSAAMQNGYRTRWPAPPPPPVDPASQAAIVAAKKLTWMPINTGAALYQYAQQQNLGYPQTDEFEVVANGDTYVVQVFNLGLVYVKKGDWGNVQFFFKPAGV